MIERCQGTCGREMPLADLNLVTWEPIARLPHLHGGYPSGEMSKAALLCGRCIAIAFMIRAERRSNADVAIPTHA